jgi:hypothetical protein
MILLLDGAIASHRCAGNGERAGDRPDWGRCDRLGSGRSCPVIGWQVRPVAGGPRAAGRQRRLENGEV